MALGIGCTLFFLFGSAPSSAQEPIYNLILEGGGMKGMAYPGALLELEKRHMLDSVRKIAGTSSGAINATVLALGYTPKELAAISYQTPYHKFNQKGFPFIGPAVRMRTKYGWYSSERFTTMLEEVVGRKVGNKDFTFAMLFDSAQANPSFKELYITGTSIDQQKTILFSHLTFPTMRIVDAVRISMTIPFYFETIFLNPDGTIVSHKDRTDSTLLMVDGGLAMNYPIHVFDTFIDDGTCSYFLPNKNTLGLRLDRSEQVVFDEAGFGIAPVNVAGLGEYMSAFYNMSFEKINRISLNAADWERTISIDTKNFNSKVRKLSAEEKDTLLKSGHNAVIRFLEKT